MRNTTRKPLPGQTTLDLVFKPVEETGQFEHEGRVFTYRVERSQRRLRTISAGIREGRIVVRSPVSVPSSRIKEFVESRAAWFVSHLESPAAPVTLFRFEEGTKLPYLGRVLELRLQPGTSRPKFVIDGDALVLSLASPADEAAAQAKIARAIHGWYGAAAVSLVNDAVSRWAPLAGRRPTKVIVRNQKARWGSCATNGTLRFNWRLAMVDPALADYVVVHELCHLIQPDHSPKFWAEVERVLPGAAVRRKALRAIEKTLPMF